MLREGAFESAIAARAALERTIVVPCLVGVEVKFCARSMILICIVSPGLQALGKTELMQLIKYCLPQAAPSSQIPSLAAAKKLLDGNCVESLPKHALAAFSTTRYITFRMKCISL